MPLCSKSIFVFLLSWYLHNFIDRTDKSLFSLFTNRLSVVVQCLICSTLSLFTNRLSVVVRCLICSLCSLTGCPFLYSALFVRLFLCCCCCTALLFPLLPLLLFLHSSSLYCAFLSSSLPPADHWDALNSFLAVAGWDFIMDLNALKRNADGSWNQGNARQLLQYSTERNYTIAGFELGNGWLTVVLLVSVQFIV